MNFQAARNQLKIFKAVMQEYIERKKNYIPGSKNFELKF